MNERIPCHSQSGAKGVNGRVGITFAGCGSGKAFRCPARVHEQCHGLFALAGARNANKSVVMVGRTVGVVSARFAFSTKTPQPRYR